MARRVQLQHLHLDDDDDGKDNDAQPKPEVSNSRAAKQNLSGASSDGEKLQQSDWKPEQDAAFRRPRLVSKDQPQSQGSPTAFGRHRLTSYSSSPGTSPPATPTAFDEAGKKSAIPLEGAAMYQGYKMEEKACVVNTTPGWSERDSHSPQPVAVDSQRGRTRTSSVDMSNSLVFQARDAGELTDLVQCLITRDKHELGGTLYPSYTMYLQGRADVPLILAQRQATARYCTFHLFGLTRARVGSVTSTKSGNYIGKLKAVDFRKSEYVLHSAEGAELAVICFGKSTVFNQLKEGPLPRKMTIVLPPLDASSIPIPHVPLSPNATLLKLWQSDETGRMFLLRSKAPTQENGTYRLNFSGRVTVPSVKNFQLTSPDSPEVLSCQFGKVGEDSFHLDYKAPLNAIQAFAVALCQFHV